MCDREQRNHKGLRELGIITVSMPEGKRTKRPYSKGARRVNTSLTLSLPPVSDQCSPIAKYKQKQESKKTPCYGPYSSAYQVTEWNVKGWKVELGSKQQGNAARCAVCRAVLSCFSCVRLFVTPWSVAHQAPLSMGFSRQEYQNGLLCPPPGDLPNPGMEPRSPTLQSDSLPSEPSPNNQN